MLDSRTKQTLESDIVYFREQQKKPTDRSVWGVPATFQEVERAIKDSTTTPDERELLKSWILEFSYLNNRITDTTAKERLEKLKKDISVVSVRLEPPAPVEDRRAISGDEEKKLRTELEEQLKTMDGKLEKMTSADLDSAISLMNNILTLSWIEKIPGFKEKAEDIRQYEPMLQAIGGAALLKKLQKLGYSLYFSASNQIKIVSSQADAQDVETKLNAYLSQSSVLGKSIQSGLLYLSPSFHTYRASVVNNDNKIIDPARVDMKTYAEYLRKKPTNTLDTNEKVFLQSLPYFDKNINFQRALTQSRDFPQVVDMMEQYTGDKSAQSLLPNATPDQSGTAPRVAPPMIDNSAAAKAGRGVGGLAGFVGKIAGTGAGGGLEFLGTAMSEAGPLGSIAIIGAILWSIFSAKGLGFMGTLGAIFGVGLLTKGDELKGILSKGKGNSAEPQVAPAAAATGAPAKAQPSQAEALKVEAQDTKPLTAKALLAESLGRDNIHEADVTKEQEVISAIKSVNIVKLQTALSTGTEADWNAAIESSGLKKGTPEYDALAKAIHRDNVFARNVMTQYVEHLMDHEHTGTLTPEQRQAKSIEQMGAFVVEKDSEKKKEAGDQSTTIPVETPPGVTIPKGTPTPDSIVRDNAAYGDLVVLARMVEYGYLPKINFTAGEVAAGGMFKKFLKGVVYVGLAGPVTNNVPGSNWFSGKYRIYETNFINYLTGLIKTERAEITTRQQAVGAGPSFGPLKEEIYARNVALMDLTEKVASKEDPKAIKEALKKYRDIAKTPWYAGRFGKKEAFVSKESEKMGKIEAVSGKIEAEYNGMKTAQEKADRENATDVEKKAAINAAQKHNQNVTELEANGIKNLSELRGETRAEIAKTNPWVARVAAANGGMQAFNTKLNDYASKGVSKGILGVGLVGLIWNHKGGVMELYNKGDFTSLAKLGWDFVAGAVPLVSTVHESAILSNGFGYRDFILGKDYEMGTVEKGFRVAGAVPLGGLATKTVGKVAIGVGEHTGIGALKRGGQMVEGVSDIAITGAKTVGQVGTYGVLGYSAVMMTYDLSNHLTGKEARKESVFAK